MSGWVTRALMSVVAARAAPLGVGNLGEASRRTSRVDTVQALLLLVVAAGGIALVCFVIWVVSRVHRWRRLNSHGSLFRGLCRTHGLDGRARGLLRQVARHHKLSHPARLFTEPKWLDPAEARGPLRRRAAELAALRRRLFA